jgi:hypothetical protein
MVEQLPPPIDQHIQDKLTVLHPPTKEYLPPKPGHKAPSHTYKIPRSEYSPPKPSYLTPKPKQSKLPNNIHASKIRVTSGCCPKANIYAPMPSLTSSFKLINAIFFQLWMLSLLEPATSSS